MAPYVMKVEVVNATEYQIVYIGSSTLKGLDGKTSVNAAVRNLSGHTIPYEISKSEGTDGLFTSLSWWIGHVHWESKGQFCIHSEMPASWGADVKAKMRDIWGMSHQQFCDTTAAGANHSYMVNDGGQIWKDTIERSGVTVKFEQGNLGFPNSHIRVFITQNVKVADIPSKMSWYEGKRVSTSYPGMVYLVLDGKARHIANPDVYHSMFGNGTILRLDSGLIDAMPKGPSLTANPSLIAVDGGKYCLVDEGRWRWIQDGKTFNNYGFDWGRVVGVGNYGGYQEGAPIKTYFAE